MHGCFVLFMLTCHLSSLNICGTHEERSWICSLAEALAAETPTPTPHNPLDQMLSQRKTLDGTTRKEGGAECKKTIGKLSFIPG
jgi:hypothetical protein